MKSSVVLLLALFISGCGGLLASQAYKDLDANQIKAVADSGSTLSGCLYVGGPPVGGGTALVVIPRTAKGSLTFSPGCQVQGTLTIGADAGQPLPPQVPGAIPTPTPAIPAQAQKVEAPKPNAPNQ